MSAAASNRNVCPLGSTTRRPTRRSICCEIYSTGKANLPGSTRQRSLLASFARMYGSLLVRSDADPATYAHVPKELLTFHKPKNATVTPTAAAAAPRSARPAMPGMRSGLDDDADLWDLGPLAACGGAEGVGMDVDEEDDDDGLLEAAGF